MDKEDMKQEALYLRRHFERAGARVKVREITPSRWRGMADTAIQVDVQKDSDGEYFDLLLGKRAKLPSVIDLKPELRHLVLMHRDAGEINKYLCGHDERHWFVAAVPDRAIKNVREAMESLKPKEIRGRAFIRQGEWFFVPAKALTFVDDREVHKDEPLSRGGGSKPHICQYLTRTGGRAVMVCNRYPEGIDIAEYDVLLLENPDAKAWRWQRMQRDATVFARGTVRHPDHATIVLDGWHQVFMNNERFATHARNVVFLD